MPDGAKCPLRRARRSLGPLETGQAVSDRVGSLAVGAEILAAEARGRVANAIQVRSLQALEVDSLTSGWEQALSDAEIALAMRHACLAGTIRADWVDRLIAARPQAALPEIISAVATEYRANGTRSDVLSTASHNDTAALSAVASKVFRLLQRSEPVDDATLDVAIRIVRRGLGIAPIPGARKLVVRRFEEHHAAGNEKRAF